MLNENNQVKVRDRLISSETETCLVPAFSTFQEGEPELLGA